GIPDIVTSGENGYLFDPQDDGGAIAATQRLLDRGAERELMRRNARIEAEKWGWNAATRQLVDFYAEILSNDVDMPSAA
ncbi:MAG: glycosyltransferase family 1 protein, partial [Cyanobacteria bacterium P01_C01_bin.147]